MDERRLTIIFPGLFDLVASRHPATFPAEFPRLARLFDRGIVAENPNLDFETAIANVYGIHGREDAETSMVELSAAIDDVPFCERLVRADPVHLRADGAQVRLFTGSMFEPNVSESARLLDELRAVFPEYEFLVGKFPGRWYVRTPEPLEFTALAPSALQQLAVEERLPTGRDAAKVHVLMNELQMALHQCAVNQDREASGLPAINSVWLWACDKRFSGQNANRPTVWGDDALVYALSQRYKLPHAGFNETHIDPAEVLRHPWDKSDKLVLFNHPCGPLREHRTEVGLERFEHEWVEPLLQALRVRRIGILEIIDMRRSLSLKAFDVWKFWRRSNYFAEKLKINIDPSKLSRDVPVDGA